MGALVLALFARQSTVMAFMTPMAQGAGKAAVVLHHQAPTQAGVHHHAAPAPASPATPAVPHHNTGCDGKSLAECCAVGSGCVSLLVPPVVAVIAAVPSARGAATGFVEHALWRDISPDDPPPRA